MLGYTEQPTPPVDRRTAHRDATKGEILQAAWTLARAEGLTGFSLRDLAASVGMRAPSLYQYFPSKHAIYDALFGQGTADALAAIGAEVRERETRAVVRGIAHRFFVFATSDPVRAQLLFQRPIPGFQPSPASYAPAVALNTWVAARLGEHGITDPDAMDMFSALVGGLIAQQLANEPGGTRWARLIDRAVDMFIETMSDQSYAEQAKGAEL